MVGFTRVCGPHGVLFTHACPPHAVDSRDSNQLVHTSLSKPITSSSSSPPTFFLPRRSGPSARRGQPDSDLFRTSARSPWIVVQFPSHPPGSCNTARQREPIFLCGSEQKMSAPGAVAVVPPDNHWICKSCTFQNKRSAAKCKGRSLSAIDTVVNTHILCPHCTAFHSVHAVLQHYVGC